MYLCTVSYWHLSLWIGYTGNDWSTSEIPLDKYQEKLQERQWEASQNKIEQLRCKLQESERELQEERREKEQVTG